MLHVLAPRFLILYVYIATTLYTHYRGTIRHRFLRQLTDHSTLMAPVNVFMYLFSAIPTKQPYIDLKNFPELNRLQENWEMIREEAYPLLEQGHVKVSQQYNDVGFNSFFRRGWKRFYLKWYNAPLPSGKALCPKTVALLESIPSINAAMFALLPKGSELVKHRDPYAGSLRYHLGLITPNSNQCRITVDGQDYFWRDGKGVMFDETYIHYAVNESDMDRLILFCDVARPMRYRFATLINRFFSKYVMTASASQNVETDGLGFLNKIFKYLYQIRLIGKRLKAFNKPFYYAVKYTLFLGILYLIFLK